MPRYEPTIRDMDFDLDQDECVIEQHHGSGQHQAGCCRPCLICLKNIRGPLFDAHEIRCRRGSSLPPASGPDDDTKPPSLY